jgi:hypothetical protein
MDRLADALDGAAERYTGVRFIGPDLPPLSPAAWHERLLIDHRNQSAGSAG